MDAIPISRICTKCNQLLAGELFRMKKHHVSKNKYQSSICKKCEHLHYRMLKKYSPDELDRYYSDRDHGTKLLDAGLRVCTKCGETKTIDNYSRSGRGVEKRSICKKCSYESQKLKYHDNDYEKFHKIEQEKIYKRDLRKLGKKICGNCKEIKLLSEFGINNTIGRKPIERSFCKICESLKAKEYGKKNPSPSGYAAKIYRNGVPFRYMLSNAVKRAVEKNLPFDLDVEYLKQIYNDSGGVCAISGLPFSTDPHYNTFDKGNAYRPSLDKIEPDKGYVRGNVRIILHCLNIALSNGGLAFYLKIAETVIDYQENKKSPESNSSGD